MTFNRTIPWLLLTVCLWFSFAAGGRAFGSEDGRSTAIRPDGRLQFVDRAGTRLASIMIEIAESPESQATGLMRRTGLDDTMGMLFIYPRPEQLFFWMRNTPTPLDIIFVSAEGIILNIASNTQPNSDTVYSSHGPAQYVVEVPAFFCARRKVAPGARIEWRRLGP